MRTLIFILILVATTKSINLNLSKEQKNIDNPPCWTDTQIWGPLLEDWALEYKTNREKRVMKLSPVDNTYIISNRNDIPSKVLNSAGVSPEKQQQRQITETDLYLLGAIEKLVYRADFMEKRLRRVEEMLYYVMAGSRVDSEPCPDNFTRAGLQCYYFSVQAGREKDWKSANKLCQKQGAVLAEMETIEENQDIVAFIQINSYLKGKDFWIGGLNPGLLWIWSNSARPVSAHKYSANSTTNILGDGPCLRLAYDPAYRNYAYRGTDCSARYQFICELPDKASGNKLTRLAKELKINL